MDQRQRQLQIVLKLQDEASAELRKLTGELNNADGTTSKWGGTLRVVGEAAAAAFATASAIAIKAVGDFERFNLEIERAGAFVNASAGELDQFRKAAIDAARGTQFSFDEAAAALGNFVGGEIDANTASKNLGKVIDLALVAKIKDLQQAVNISSTALTVFKKDGMEMSDVIDIISQVAANVTTQTDQWATAIVNSAGAAKSAGFSFKDLNVVFSEMVRGGADVNLIWSAFNSAMTNIQNPSKQGVEALDSVGLSAKGLSESLRGGPITMLEYLRGGFEKANESGQGFAFLADTLGRQAAPEFALALGLTNEELKSTAGYFDNITGKGEEMTGKIRAAIPATDLFKQSLSELSIALGGALEPLAGDALRSIATDFQEAAKWVTNYKENMAELKGTIADSLQTFDEQTGLITLMKDGWNDVVLLYQQELKPALDELWVALKPFQPLLEALGKVFGTILVVAIGGFIDMLRLSADSIIILLTWMTKAYTFILTMLTPAFEGIGTTILKVAGYVDTLIAKFKEAWDWASKVASSAGNFVSGAVSSVGNKIGSILPGRASGGPVTGGAPYMVGERGPELFVPRTSGTIVPNGAGMTVNVVVNGDVSGTELVERVQEAIMSSLRMNTKFAI